MTTSTFYNAVRPLFGGSLSQSQVDGLSTLLDATADLPFAYRAYILATAYHETGGNMSPNREGLNYSVDGLLKTFGRHRITAEQARKYGRSGSRPADQRAIANTVYGGSWGRSNLGNTNPNDGWDYRGGGQVHTTGRTNFDRVKLASGVDVITYPDKIVDPKVSAIALIQGCLQGWYTGKRLSDYLDAKTPDYVGARRVVNGTDKAAQIAGYARSFEKALRHLPVGTPVIDAPAPAPTPKPIIIDLPAVDVPDIPTPPSVLGALMALWSAIFRR